MSRAKRLLMYWGHPCCRSVSLPVPAYYAHHVAFQGRSLLPASDPREVAAVKAGQLPFAFVGVDRGVQQTMYFM
jgi:hypothetical protein